MQALIHLIMIVPGKIYAYSRKNEYHSLTNIILCDKLLINKEDISYENN